MLWAPEWSRRLGHCLRSPASEQGHNALDLVKVLEQRRGVASLRGKPIVRFSQNSSEDLRPEPVLVNDRSA